MSSHIFCPECGTKAEYDHGVKPNFCFSCGYNFKDNTAFKPKSSSSISMDDVNISMDGGSHGGRGKPDRNSFMDSVKVSGMDDIHLDENGKGTRVSNGGVAMKDVLFSRAGDSGFKRTVPVQTKRDDSFKRDVLKKFKQRSAPAKQEEIN